MPADGFPVVSNTIGAQMLQYENASRFVDAMCKYEECGDSTPIALVVEEYLKIEEGKTEKVLNQDEDKEVGKNLNKIVEAKSRAVATDMLADRKKVMEDLYGSFESSNEDGQAEEEKAHENTFKSPCIAHLVPSVSFPDKVPQIPNASPSCPKRKSAVIRLSFKRRSCDGDETTEFCKYTSDLL